MDLLEKNEDFSMQTAERVGSQTRINKKRKKKRGEKKKIILFSKIVSLCIQMR